MHLKYVAYAPNVCLNLLSVKCLTAQGFTINFEKKVGVVLGQNKEELMRMEVGKNGLYKVVLPQSSSYVTTDSLLTPSTKSVNEKHDKEWDMAQKTWTFEFSSHGPNEENELFQGFIRVD